MDANALVRKHKSALTRAKKKGPIAVLASCDAAFEAFDTLPSGWPDCWHLWNIAKSDAEIAIRFS